MKKNTIIISTITIFFISAIIILIFFYQNKLKENVASVETISKDQLYELMSNNYKLSYLLTGKIKIGEGTATDSETAYYIIDDKELTSLNSLEDILNLFEKTLQLDENDNYANFLIENVKYNHIVEITGKSKSHLYVKLKDQPCNIPTLELSKISYEKIDDNNIDIKYNNVIVTKGIKANNRWLTNKLAFTC